MVLVCGKEATRLKSNLERLLLARSPRFQAMLGRSRKSVKAERTVKHYEFWLGVAERQKMDPTAKVSGRRQGDQGRSYFRPGSSSIKHFVDASVSALQKWPFERLLRRAAVELNTCTRRSSVTRYLPHGVQCRLSAAPTHGQVAIVGL